MEGCFEEIKLSRFYSGDPVLIRLMGNAISLTGVLESIAAGVEDPDHGRGASLLAIRPSVGYTLPSVFSSTWPSAEVPIRPAGEGRSATVEVVER